jgi:hydroxymethylglutaryl-CoA reductase
VKSAEACLILFAAAAGAVLIHETPGFGVLEGEVNKRGQVVHHFIHFIHAIAFRSWQIGAKVCQSLKQIMPNCSSNRRTT